MITISIKSHLPPSAEAHAGETGESHRRKRRGYKKDRETPERLRRIRDVEALSDSGEDQDRHREAERGREAEDYALAESVALLDVEEGGTENGAVGRDKGQIDAERSVKRGKSAPNST